MVRRSVNNRHSWGCCCICKYCCILLPQYVKMHLRGQKYQEPPRWGTLLYIPTRGSFLWLKLYFHRLLLKSCCILWFLFKTLLVSQNQNRNRVRKLCFCYLAQSTGCLVTAENAHSGFKDKTDICSNSPKMSLWPVALIAKDNACKVIIRFVRYKECSTVVHMSKSCVGQQEAWVPKYENKHGLFHLWL